MNYDLYTELTFQLIKYMELPVTITYNKQEKLMTVGLPMSRIA